MGEEYITSFTEERSRVEILWSAQRIARARSDVEVEIGIGFIEPHLKVLKDAINKRRCEAARMAGG
jgi:hypothetical protein